MSVWFGIAVAGLAAAAFFAVKLTIDLALAAFWGVAAVVGTVLSPLRRKRRH